MSQNIEEIQPLLLQEKYFVLAREAKTVDDLRYLLQKAIELEHSTIPPYLTAMFSLKPGKNDIIVDLIRQIVVQEMLHMTIAANILIAIGGTPKIGVKDFVPSYPGPLPMVEGITVGIEAFSKKLLKNIFMRIEHPDFCPVPIGTSCSDNYEASNKNNLPKEIRPFNLSLHESYRTIGAFYRNLRESIEILHSDGQISFGNKDKQITPENMQEQWFKGDLFLIDSLERCKKAIDVILREGEGTRGDPFQNPDTPAHYYRFKAITLGRKLIKYKNGEYKFCGDLIPFDSDGVFLMKPNPKIDDFQGQPLIHSRIKQFAGYYSSLLDTLHQAFNGNPRLMGKAIAFMYDLRVTAVGLMQMKINDEGQTAGPSFEYIHPQDRLEI